MGPLLATCLILVFLGIAITCALISDDGTLWAQLLKVHDGEDNCADDARYVGRVDAALRKSSASRQPMHAGFKFDSLVYHHVPHTGGSALIHTLEQICTAHNLNCADVGHCFSRDIGNHSLDVIWGHFTVKLDEILRVVKGRPLIFTMMRDPYQTTRSDYFWKGLHSPWTSVNHYMNTERDTMAQMLSGVSRFNRVYKAHSADPGCVMMMRNVRRFHLFAPYEHLSELLLLVHRLHLAQFGVAEEELCMPRRNIITNSDRMAAMVEKFDMELIPAAREAFELHFGCTKKAWMHSMDVWQVVRNESGGDLEREGVAFAERCRNA